MNYKHVDAEERRKLNYWTMLTIEETAREEGYELGWMQGREEVEKKRVINLFLHDYLPAKISKLFGIPIEKVQQIIFDYQNKI